MNSIEVLSTGFFSTFQDRGRRGYRKFGVPLSGVMDAYSAGLANMLLNNSEDAPVIEITLQGSTLKFNCSTLISITGADMSPMINGKAVDRNKVIVVKAGDQLSFGKLISGCRSYLAIKGGFECEKILESYSYYPGIADNNILKAGMSIKIREQRHQNEIHASVKIDEDHLASIQIEVQRGPEFKWLSTHQQKTLFENDFKVSAKNNRMGYQVEGPIMKIENGFDMLTAITIPGTVQLTPLGNPIVLMRDCQTTGGYPRILQLTEKGINRLAQKKTNDPIRFQLI